MDEIRRRAEALSRPLAPGVREIAKGGNGDERRAWRSWLHVADSHIGEAVAEELRTLVSQNDEMLRGARPRAALSRVLSDTGCHSREVLWRLLAEPVEDDPADRAIDGARKRPGGG